MHEDDDSYCMTPREIAATVAFWLLLACAALFVLAWYFLASTASAHDAPTGWTYPYSCCSGQDCREVTSGPQGRVRETPQGYQIASTGEVMPRYTIRAAIAGQVVQREITLGELVSPVLRRLRRG